MIFSAERYYLKFTEGNFIFWLLLKFLANCSYYGEVSTIAGNSIKHSHYTRGVIRSDRKQQFIRSRCFCQSLCCKGGKRECFRKVTYFYIHIISIHQLTQMVTGKNRQTKLPKMISLKNTGKLLKDIEQLRHRLLENLGDEIFSFQTRQPLLFHLLKPVSPVNRNLTLTDESIEKACTNVIKHFELDAENQKEVRVNGKPVLQNCGRHPNTD